MAELLTPADLAAIRATLDDLAARLHAFTTGERPAWLGRRSFAQLADVSAHVTHAAEQMVAPVQDAEHRIRSS